MQLPWFSSNHYGGFSFNQGQRRAGCGAGVGTGAGDESGRGNVGHLVLPYPQGKQQVAYVLQGKCVSSTR